MIASLSQATRHAACCAQEFVAELVAFTRKTAMMLFSPPLHKFPVPFVHKLVIHLVVLEVRLTGADGVAVPLSQGEFLLLTAFLDHSGRVLTRDQLLDLTRGRSAVPFDRSIDNQVSRLRRKIEPDPKTPTLIQTVWGGGYRFTAKVER